MYFHIEFVRVRGKRTFLYIFMKSLHGKNLKNGRLFTSDEVCIGILNTHVNIDTYRQGGRIHTHETDHTKPHMLPHTASPPPMAPYTLPPSLPHSLKRREPVKDARRKHADRVVEQVEAPGHETRRQSALTHSTMPAVSISMHVHVPHAHAPCTCTCAPCLSLSRCICAHRACLCACACAACYEYKKPM